MITTTTENPKEKAELVDVMIPLGPRDGETGAVSTRAAVAFVAGVRTIYVVARNDPRIAGTQFIDERIFPFSIASIRQMLQIHDRAGWYLQQLIKFYFPTIVTDALDRVLVIDADTLFLRKCRFIEDGRVVFNFGDEYHEPYFHHMKRLHPQLRKLNAYSGVTHCMLFERRWLKELMAAVELHHRQPPLSFWKIFLTAVDPAHREYSGASEYEIYFNFCLGRHPQEIVLRRFHWRNIATIDEVRPDLYDYVSLHWHSRKEEIECQRLIQKIF